MFLRLEFADKIKVADEEKMADEVSLGECIFFLDQENHCFLKGMHKDHPTPFFPGVYRIFWRYAE